MFLKNLCLSMILTMSSMKPSVSHLHCFGLGLLNSGKENTGKSAESRHEKSSKPSADMYPGHLKFPQIQSLKFPQLCMVCYLKYLLLGLNLRRLDMV